MATERIVDLANKRYADRPYEGPLPLSGAAEAEARAAGQHAALARLRERVHETGAPQYLTRSDLSDLLTLLGLGE